MEAKLHKQFMTAVAAMQSAHRGDGMRFESINLI